MGLTLWKVSNNKLSSGNGYNLMCTQLELIQKKANEFKSLKNK